MFDGYIRDHARWTPRAPAVVTAARTSSYAEFDADVDRCAAALADFGLAPDAVVSISVRDDHLQLLLIAALARLGIASSPAADPGCDVRLTDRARATQDGSPTLVLDAAWTTAMYAAEPRPLPPRRLDPLAVGRVMLSSGTT